MRYRDAAAIAVVSAAAVVGNGVPALGAPVHQVVKSPAVRIITHRVHVGQDVKVRVRFPVCVVNPEVDAESADSTPDSPVAFTWGFRQGRVPAGRWVTVKLRVTRGYPAEGHLGTWYADMIAGVPCYGSDRVDEHVWPVTPAEFRVIP